MRLIILIAFIPFLYCTYRSVLLIHWRLLEIRRFFIFSYIFRGILGSCSLFQRASTQCQHASEVRRDLYRVLQNFIDFKWIFRVSDTFGWFIQNFGQFSWKVSECSRELLLPFYRSNTATLQQVLEYCSTVVLRYYCLSASVPKCLSAPSALVPQAKPKWTFCLPKSHT